MKTFTFVLTILIFNISNDVYSQTVDKSKLPDLEPYVGTWIGSSGADSLVVSLYKKQVYFEPLNVNVDQLYGKFRNYKNGQLINNNFNSKENTLITGGLRRDSNGKPSLLDFTFRDLRMEKRGRLSLIFKDSSQIVVTWKLQTREAFFINQKLPDDFSEFSVPKELILRKIK